MGRTVTRYGSLPGVFRIWKDALEGPNRNTRNTVTVTPRPGGERETPLGGFPISTLPAESCYTSKPVTPSTEDFLTALVVAHDLAHTVHLADCLPCRGELRDVIDTLDGKEAAS